MLLSEVARTGRRFRRKSEPETWLWLQGKQLIKRAFTGPDGHGRELPGGEVVAIDAEMLVATDWESEPKAIEITAQDLMDVAKNLSQHPITNQRRLAPAEFMKLVIEELGLHE